jgi:LuxR family maltose regulon positive regulatory protein
VLEKTEARTILLVAPAGYGKTTLARQWLEQAGGAWVTLTPASVDVPVLARDLAAAIGLVADLDYQSVESALSGGRTSAEQMGAVARTILGQVSGPVERWIVIDDYHLLDSRSPSEELLARIERSGRFRFLITSRVRPHWSTPRRRLYMETFELGVGDLALDDLEVTQLLEPDRRTLTLRRQARGWPAVIGLAARSPLSDIPLNSDALAATLYDYFAEELFDRAPPDVQRGLTALAILPELHRSEIVDLIHIDPDSLVEAGLAYEVDGNIGVHPLAKAYLVTRLSEQQDSERLRDAAFTLAIQRGLYDHAFALISELEMDHRVAELIVASYTTLIETGRVATIARFVAYAEANAGVPQAIVDLVAAEVAVLAGRLDEGESLGISAAAQLPESHPLKARACLVAARAAHLGGRCVEALDLYADVKRHAFRSHELNEAIWGTVAIALVAEGDGLKSAFRDLESLPTTGLTDRVRLECARIHLARVEGRRPNLSEGARIVGQITDPWVKSAWGHLHGYALVLDARYVEAAAILRGVREELKEIGFSFALHHLEWTLAASELGLRHFSRCEALLRRVERRSEHSRDPYSQLNVCALQARVHLAQQRPREALEITQDDFDNPPSRAMYGEYLATRALALAVVGDSSGAVDAAREAVRLTRSVEVRILSFSAIAVSSRHDEDLVQESILALLDEASGAGAWDGLVCMVRAVPEMITLMSAAGSHRSELGEVLLRANEFGLAKMVGKLRGSAAAGGLLSPRERDVIEHLRQGKKNAEIAASLFITVGTVKRHLDHIYDKLGTRSRAGAIARYVEIEGIELEGASGQLPAGNA